VSRQRARRLEAVGARIQEQLRTFRQPFILDHIPTREVIRILSELATLAGDYQRPAAPAADPKED
jgi:hypothetical protein